MARHGERSLAPGYRGRWIASILRPFTRWRTARWANGKIVYQQCDTEAQPRDGAPWVVDALQRGSFIRCGACGLSTGIRLTFNDSQQKTFAVVL